MIDKKIFYILLTAGLLFAGISNAQLQKDSARIAKRYSLDEVVVTGSRYETDARHLPMSVSVITREQIARRYEQSLLPLLTEQVPGLFITGRGVMGYGVSGGAAGGMALRGIGGSPTAGLLVLVDGHPQYMGLMGHPIADAYQSQMAEKVEVVRGPASVLYGSNAMGGVINIVTRKSQENGVRNNVKLNYGSYNTLVAEVSSMVRSGRFSSIVAGSYNRTDGHRADMEFEQYGGYAKSGYEFSPEWKAFADINLTHFNASNPGSEAKPVIDNDSRITRGMTSLSVENNYSKTSGALKFYYNWGYHKINDGYSAGEKPLSYRFNSRDRMLGITWYQSASLFAGNRITVGVDYQHIGGNAWNRFLDESRKDITDRTENEVAGYIDFRQVFARLFTLDMGVRIDHHSRTGTVWIPQIGLSANVLKNGELKAMVSKGFRNPTLRDLYMFALQNPDLQPESILSYELSWSQRLLDNSLLYGVNLFYIDGDNMIVKGNVNDRQANVNTGDVKNWGIESNVTYRINTAWTASANYSWLKMKYPVVAAPEHKLYAGIDYSCGKWNISTGAQYIRGLYTSVDPEIQETFVLWNLRGSFRLCNFAEVYLKGENLLAQRYEINAGYPMPRATFMGGVNLNF